MILNKMGLIDLDRRQFDKARCEILQAIEWQRKVLAAKPENSQYRQLLDDYLTVLIRAAGPGLHRRGRRSEPRTGRPSRLESAIRSPRCPAGRGPRRQESPRGRTRANQARLPGL